MPYVMKCPRCPHSFSVPTSAKTTTCPKCFNTFDAVRPKAPEDAKSGSKAKGADADDDREPSGMSLWLNPWGAAALCCAAIGTVLASLIAARLPTIGLSALGVILVFVAIPLTSGKREFKDNLWLFTGGGFSAVVLLLAVAAPQLLSSYWALTVPVAPPDPNMLTKVARDQRMDPGTAVTSGEYVNASAEIIRQRDLLIHIESAEQGTLPDKGPQGFYLIRVQLINVGRSETTVFDGFQSDKGRPQLKDEAGHDYAFVEARPRKERLKGAPVFEPSRPGPWQIKPMSNIEQLLIFTPPPTNITLLRLELPAASWNRSGVLKFTLPVPFLKE